MSLSTYKPHYRRNLSLAYPIILSQAGQMITGIADNVMVGQVGTTSLAAASFANGVFMNLMIFGMGFTFGLTPLVGTAWGRRNYQEAGKLVQNSLSMNLLVGLVLFMLLLLAKPLLPLLDQPPEVLELALPYFSLLVFSMLPLMFFFTFKQFAEAVSVTKPAMVFTLAGNLLNILLNYILIFGKLGFEPMGLMGAGWATLISRIFMGVGLYWYIVRAKKFQVFSGFIRRPIKFEKGRWKQLSLLGFPIALQFLLEGGAFSVGTIMMGWLGKIELAAHQIALSLASFTFMTISGLAAATTIRVSNLYGEENYPEMKKAAHASYHLTFLFMALCAIIFLVAQDFLPSLFIDDQKVILTASGLLVLAAFFQIFDGLQVCAMSALRGLGDVRVPTAIAFVSYWLISLPVGYGIAFHTGLGEKGIWIGFCAGLGTACLLLMPRFEFAANRLVKQHPKKNQRQTTA